MSYPKTQENSGKVTEYASPKPYVLSTKLSFFCRQQRFQVMPLLIKYSDFLNKNDFQFADRLVNHFVCGQLVGYLLALKIIKHYLYSI